jgi:phospholipase C
MIRNSVRAFATALVAVSLVALGAARAAGPAGSDAAPAKHHIQTVFIILMENHNWTGGGANSIKGNAAAPYINNTLIPMASHAEQYFNPPGNHPSLPNYLWLEAGTNFGILNDGPPSQNSQTTKKHLVTFLKTAGISWKAYLENTTGEVCPLSDNGEYAVRHEPFGYFDDVTNHLKSNSPYCIAHLRPYTELATDLANDTVASYNWITPNLCDDMHDTCGGNSIAHGDTWLSQNVPAILNSTAYQNGGALFIVWDEAASGDGPIPMLVLSPFAKGNGYSNSTHYTHGSMLRTIQEIFSVKPLLRDAKTETDLSDMFSVFP